MRNGVVPDYDPYTIHKHTSDVISGMEMEDLIKHCNKNGLTCDMQRSFNIDQYDNIVRIEGRAEDAYSMVAAAINYEHNANELASDRGPSRTDQLENELESCQKKYKRIIDEISERFKEESDTDLFYSKIWDKALNIVKDILENNDSDD